MASCASAGLFTRMLNFNTMLQSGITDSYASLHINDFSLGAKFIMG
jgi:hypothetical protein